MTVRPEKFVKPIAPIIRAREVDAREWQAVADRTAKPIVKPIARNVRGVTFGKRA